VSGGERPDLEALRELEGVLRHLEAELASWRRRALASEQRAGELEASAAPAGDEAGVATRNRELEQRLESARTRVADLLDRLNFLEQQRGNGGV
jgi:chromosome segregation ATPase